jgi:hypothetical protein
VDNENGDSTSGYILTCSVVGGLLVAMIVVVTVVAVLLINQLSVAA